MRAVVFDLDGLLIDSERWSWQAHNAVLERFALPPLDLCEVRELVGLDPTDEWPALLRMRAIPVSRQEYQLQQNEEFRRVRTARLAPMPGARALLEFLVHNDIAVGLASNSHRRSVDTALAELDIAQHFATTVSVDDVSRGKPDPEVYLRALQELAVSPEQALALEDSPVGVQAARAAGLFVVAVPNALTAHQDFRQAHRVAADLAQVQHWISSSTLQGEGVLNERREAATGNPTRDPQRRSLRTGIGL